MAQSQGRRRVATVGDASRVGKKIKKIHVSTTYENCVFLKKFQNFIPRAKHKKSIKFSDVLCISPIDAPVRRTAFCSVVGLFCYRIVPLGIGFAVLVFFCSAIAACCSPTSIALTSSEQIPFLPSGLQLPPCPTTPVHPLLPVRCVRRHRPPNRASGILLSRKEKFLVLDCAWSSYL